MVDSAVRKVQKNKEPMGKKILRKKKKIKK
jgi:hypothetical protein